MFCADQPAVGVEQRAAVVAHLVDHHVVGGALQVDRHLVGDRRAARCAALRAVTGSTRRSAMLRAIQRRLPMRMISSAARRRPSQRRRLPRRATVVGRVSRRSRPGRVLVVTAGRASCRDRRSAPIDRPLADRWTHDRSRAVRASWPSPRRRPALPGNVARSRRPPRSGAALTISTGSSDAPGGRTGGRAARRTGARIRCRDRAFADRRAPTGVWIGNSWPDVAHVEEALRLDRVAARCPRASSARPPRRSSPRTRCLSSARIELAERLVDTCARSRGAGRRAACRAPRSDPGTRGTISVGMCSSRAISAACSGRRRRRRPCAKSRGS